MSASQSTIPTQASASSEGVAEIIEPWSEPYLKLLEYKHIPAENLRKLPGMMHLIQVTPLSVK